MFGQLIVMRTAPEDTVAVWLDALALAVLEIWPQLDAELVAKMCTERSWPAARLVVEPPQVSVALVMTPLPLMVAQLHPAEMPSACQVNPVGSKSVIVTPVAVPVPPLCTTIV